MAIKYIPYTYLVGWSKFDLWYYGSQYGKHANPINLWKTYFTSSKEVQITREYCGNPDIIEIRKTFDDREKCINWEHKILKKLKVAKNEKWLNKSDNKTFPLMPDYQRKIVNLKIANSNKGKKRVNFKKTDKFLQSVKNNLLKIKNYAKPSGFMQGEKNSMYGKTHSEEAKMKMRNTKMLRKQMRIEGVI